jgi:peroxisomal 3,2-trans-enoyl-CoA isomerase
LIDFPKLLIAVIQGPAYGISVTTLPFFDLVYAAPEATFTTPFSTLGICLEGCSSVTFPVLLGQALSTRLLYMADTITCEEMNKTGLIAEVLPASGMEKVVLEKVEKQLETLSYKSIVASKGLVWTAEKRKALHKVNQEEMAVLAERVQSEDHRQALAAFQERRKAKKASKL